MHHARDGRRGYVDVGQNRGAREALALHELLELDQLAQVEANLRDEEAGSESDLQPHLVKLHHQIGLAQLEGVDHRAGEEVERRSLDSAGAEAIFETAA